MVDDRRLDRLTLREKFTDAERLIRELAEHLEQGFCPKVGQTLQLVRPTPSGLPAANVEDITVRTQVAALLESDQFSDRLYESLEKYLAAIDASVGKIVGGEG
jgi:hypothetical protein